MDGGCLALHSLDLAFSIIFFLFHFYSDYYFFFHFFLYPVMSMFC